MKRLYVRTFGCQMNVYDTGKMKALLARDGYETTNEMWDADLVIVNTCSVRDKPEQKLHGFLGEALAIKRKRRKDAKVTVAVAGCVAQQEGQKLLDRYPALDLVFGPDAVPSIVKLVAAAEKEEQVLDTSFLDAEDYVFASEIDPEASSQVGGFVTIQKGCDNKCTFCIVPATRGPELSRSSSEIVSEVKDLVAQGVQEVTLLGQNVNSYGLKVAGEKTFAQLLYAVANVPGVERIRYTTSHPRDMGPDVVQAYRDLPQLTSHLHLPVQSGSDRVLKRMKRFYTRERYLRLVDALTDARPDLALTTDIIVGFPGETDEDFADTLSLLEAVGFHGAFSFKYSPRPGTPALRLLARDEEVAADVAQKRLLAYQARQREIGIAQNKKLLGTTQRVLVEGPSRHDPSVLCGRTGTFKTVNFPAEGVSVGDLVDVTIIGAFTNSLRGDHVAAPA